MVIPNLKLNSKKGQYKIKEMIFMLIFITIFFAIVFLFYISISSSGIKETYYQNMKTGALLLVTRLADSPELGCGKSLCIDSDKLVVLKEHQVFSNFWTIDGLVIKKIYPDSANKTIECNVGNYPNCNTYTIKKPINNSVPDESFASLCRVESKDRFSYQKCELGKILVYTSKELKK
jgi:hypothetical protein